MMKKKRNRVYCTYFVVYTSETFLNSVLQTVLIWFSILENFLDFPAVWIENRWRN